MSANQPSTRLLIISLDGVPYSFLRAQLAAGRLPNVARLAREGDLRPAVSVQPPASSVAWTSFVTARNPGKHDVFGFIDRRPGTYELYIPTASDVKAQTIWEWLSRHDRRLACINVPVTYPPKPVKGVLVGDFLAPQLEGATYPPELAPRLAALGYKLDVDPWLAHHDMDRFLAELHAVLAGRQRAALALLREGPWDVFMLHIMETDRLNHFLWRHFEEGQEPYASQFLELYQAVDAVVGEVVEAAGPPPTVLMLSDHGFCAARQAVFVNSWLAEQGWLELECGGQRPQLSHLTAGTRAYALDPARFYLHVRGREPRGTLAPGQEYEQVREELAAALLAWRDPATGAPIIKRVYRREELYRGLYFDHAPDLVAEPHEGYDLRARLGVERIFDPDTPQVGMHTYHDAFWLVWGAQLTDQAMPSVMDGGATVLALLGVSLARDMDGQPRAAL
jgi:predicted AlkP superfamily phosphohydrolase/phosphomutase